MMHKGNRRIQARQSRKVLTFPQLFSLINIAIQGYINHKCLIMITCKRRQGLRECVTVFSFVYIIYMSYCYYSSIILNSFGYLLFQKLCQHNLSGLTVTLPSSSDLEFSDTSECIFLNKQPESGWKVDLQFIRETYLQVRYTIHVPADAQAQQWHDLGVMLRQASIQRMHERIQYKTELKQT